MFETANYIEAGFWIVIGAVIMVTAVIRHRVDRWTWLSLGVFVAFGISDIVEVSTGAWWRPWWLLLWKAACVLVMTTLLVRYVKRRRRSESNELTADR